MIRTHVLATRPLLSLFLLALAFASEAGAQGGSGCGSYQEPPFSFAGITTQEELNQFFVKMGDREMEAFDAFQNCQKQRDTPPTMKWAEQKQYQADLLRFSKQLEAAGKAHLAMLASQPASGLYGGYSSSGGPSQSSGSRQNQSAGESDGSAGSGRSATNSDTTQAARSGDYPPIEGCLTARNGADNFGKISRITNHCNEPIEAIWIDTKGGKNQATVGANGSFQGGDPVKMLWACRKNDGVRIVNGNSATCHH